MTQPPHSGIPQPVPGVTGGPGLNSGNASIDPGTGNIVLTPPGNAVEIKKAPSQLNVYEYFNSNTDFARLALATQTGGPETIGVQAQPPSVNRDLQIVAAGVGHVIIPSLQLPVVTASGTTTTLATPNLWTDLVGTTLAISIAGVYWILAEFVANNSSGAQNTMSANVAPASTGTSGAPAAIAMLAGVNQPNGIQSYYSFGGIATLSIQSYKMQGFNSTGANVSGTGRWTAVKIG